MKKSTDEKKSSDNEFQFTPTVIYLILYNLVQAIGWAAIFINTIMNSDHQNQLYDGVKVLLSIFQTLALLEIVHAATGLVRSNPVLTGFQVLSRVYIVLGVFNLVAESQKQIGLLLVLIAWCITEVIRYSYYAAALLQNMPYALQWARYTLFFVLYPLGVTGELLSVYTALPYVRQRGILSISLPNVANISFNYYYALIVIMLSYIPIFPQLYGHMIAQRRKIIGGEERPKTE